MAAAATISATQTSASEPIAWRHLKWVLIGGLLIRVAAIGVQNDSLRGDPDAYRAIAECVARYGVYGQAHQTNGGIVVRSTAFRPPLYPLLLAAIAPSGTVRTYHVATLHAVLGAATVGLTWWLAAKSINSLAANLVAAWVAVDPLLIRQSSLVMTETLATFLAVLLLWALVRFAMAPSSARAALAGFVLGIACLARPTFLPLVPVFAVALGYIASRPMRTQYILLYVLSVAAPLAPWTVRNWQIFGRPIVTTTHGGYTLLLGNNPHFYEFLHSRSWDDVWDPTAFHADWQKRQTVDSQLDDGRRSDELESDAIAYELARRTIREQPGLFVRSCFLRVAWLWRPMPQRLAQDESTISQLARILIAFWYLAIDGLAVLGLVRLSRSLWHSPWIFGLALCLGFTAVHAIYWSNIRMRAPLMPFVYLVAASAMVGARKISAQRHGEL